MARKFHYRPYRRPKKTARNTVYFLLTLLGIVIVIVLLKSRPNKLAGADSSQQDFTLNDTPISEPPPQIVPEPKPQPLVGGGHLVGVAPPPDTAKPEIKPAVGTDQDAVALIEEAINDRNAGRIIAARDKLNDALTMQLAPKDRQALKTQVARLSKKWLFSRDPYPTDTLTAIHVVKSGEMISEIAKRYKVPYEILMKINNIRDPKLLQAGQKIKVINGPFHAIVYLSTFTMDLYLQSTYVKTYEVGLGTEKNSTPAGGWKVKPSGKLIKPTWTDPESGRTYIASDPDYPLGSRWIALQGIEGNAKGRTGFAIHGTKDPETIGTRSSRGCIRLFNGDAMEVYDLFVSGLSEVRTVE